MAYKSPIPFQSLKAESSNTQAIIIAIDVNERKEKIFIQNERTLIYMFICFFH